MILSLESSCDETAVALFDSKEGYLQEWIHSQMDLHEAYGGVVPDLASRAHLEQFPLLLRRLQEERGRLDANSAITAIGVTAGPGLAGCLAIGIAVAKALGLALDVPVYGVNHLRAHAFSVFLSSFLENPEEFQSRWSDQLPHLGLLVSGGNTLLYVFDRDFRIRIVGDTRDDAAGEALDKGAKLLGLAYPGGPLVEKYARGGDPSFYHFPRAEKSTDSAASVPFSFSGLKTSLRYYLEKIPDSEFRAHFQDICASYLDAVIGQLYQKTQFYLQEHGEGIRSLGLSGGVANNRLLRDKWRQMAQDQGLPLFIADPAYCGDNASMIAFNAEFDKKGVFSEEREVVFSPSLSLDSER